MERNDALCSGMIVRLMVRMMSGFSPDKMEVKEIILVAIWARVRHYLKRGTRAHSGEIKILYSLITVADLSKLIDLYTSNLSNLCILLEINSTSNFKK